ncbi:hypothetical protein JCM10207_001044 [Rhodosporidiobolus poonsookiae]
MAAQDLQRANIGEEQNADGSSPSPLERRLESALASRRSRQMLRSLDPAPTSEPLVDFSSNDYLSFAASPVLHDKLMRALSTPSTTASSSTPTLTAYGPPSSRLLDGNTPLHLSLESRLSSFLHAPSALLFNSGFDANAGLWASLPGAEDWIVFDALVHASMHDGMRASRVPRERRRAFRHNCVQGLEERIREALRDEKVKDGEKSVWIGVESLYSMDGDLVPLREMVELVERLLPRGNGHFVVDEAHSTGLYGDQGRGLVCALGLESRITVRVHTFGKALACSGAAVLASPLIRNYLINYARPLIYSTAATRMSVLAAQKSVEMLEEGQGEGPAAHVHALARLLVSHLLARLPPHSPVSLPPHLLSLPPPPASPSSASAHPPTSPIVPLLTPTPRPLAAFLRTRGFLVRPITYPTVPVGEERVRVCLHAGNTEGEVRGLCEGVVEWVEGEMRRGRSATAKAKL